MPFFITLNTVIKVSVEFEQIGNAYPFIIIPGYVGFEPWILNFLLFFDKKVSFFFGDSKIMFIFAPKLFIVKQ